MGKRRASPPPASATPGGGRAWWAHLDFTRVNIHPIIVRNQIEDRMEIMESAPFSGDHSLNELSAA
jgi:hypothetical protein